MEPKEIRKKILEILYSKRSDFFVDPQTLLAPLGVTDEVLDMEIRYLNEKGFLKIMGKHNGKFLNFAGIKISANGIDLVEDHEEFNKLFTIKISNNNFGDVKDSQLNINAENTNQIQNKSETKNQKWHQKWWFRYIILPITVGLIIAFVAYCLGWNK